MKNLKYTDKILLFVSSLLFIIGIIMIFSASNVAAVLRYNTSVYQFFTRQTIHLIIGLVFFLFAINFSTKSYSASSWLLLPIFTFLLVSVQVTGYIVNGAKSWIDIWFFRFQPSEFMKVIIIMWFAAFFELNRKKLNSMLVNIIPFIAVGIIAILIFIQPDLGTAAIFVAIPFFLYLLLPINKIVKLKTILLLVFAVLIAGLSAYILFPGKFETAKDRFNFKEPCSEEKFYTTGNQVCNSFIAFNNGGLFGKGLGKSTQKYLYLSDSHTDFIFAIIVEELGFLVSSVIIILYAVLLWRIIYIGNKSTSSRGSIFCYGVAIYIFLHIVINLLGIMGEIPLTGVPLPFMSFGGTFALTLIGALTLVQRVAIETRLNK